MIATGARDDGFEYGCRNKSRRCQMLLTLLSLRRMFVHTFHFQIFFFKNKKLFKMGGGAVGPAQARSACPPFKKVFCLFLLFSFIFIVFPFCFCRIFFVFALFFTFSCNNSPQCKTIFGQVQYNI